METACSFELLANFYQTTWHYIYPETIFLVTTISESDTGCPVIEVSSF
jgi:hypothetical protein